MSSLPNENSLAQQSVETNYDGTHDQVVVGHPSIFSEEAIRNEKKLISTIESKEQARKRKKLKSRQGRKTSQNNRVSTNEGFAKFMNTSSIGMRSSMNRHSGFEEIVEEGLNNDLDPANYRTQAKSREVTHTSDTFHHQSEQLRSQMNRYQRSIYHKILKNSVNTTRTDLYPIKLNKHQPTERSSHSRDYPKTIRNFQGIGSFNNVFPIVKNPSCKNQEKLRKKGSFKFITLPSNVNTMIHTVKFSSSRNSQTSKKHNKLLQAKMASRLQQNTDIRNHVREDRMTPNLLSGE